MGNVSMREKIDSFKPENRILQAVLAVILIIGIILSAQYVKSQQLRQEMLDSRNRSYAVTNQTCGFEKTGPEEWNYSNYRTCSGAQECFQLEEYEKPRCVVEDFERYYCGIHTSALIEQSKPPGIDCGFKYGFENTVISWIKPFTIRFFDLLGFGA